MIVHAYYPIGETRVEREALALHARGYSVDVICLRHGSELPCEVVDGITVYRLPVSRGTSRTLLTQVAEYLHFFWLVFFKLLQLYPRKRYATIQTHNLPDFLIFSALIPKLAGARLILDIHDIMPEFMAVRTGKGMNSLPVRLTILQEQLSCRFADFVITVTELWKERLIQRGVRPGKVGVVMNLADERFFHPVPPEQRPPRASDRFTLIYHGTFKQHYGLDVLIKAVAIARQQAPDLLVILQGFGEYSPQMKAMVEEMGLEENVRINDFFLSTAELPGLIYQADLGVIPNYEDVFTGELLPTKLLEYVALGVPAIAARTRAISAYFDDRMIRFFTPGDEHSLAEAIVDAYRHREKLPEQARELERFTSRYNWTTTASQYVEMVDRLSRRMGGKSLSREIQPQEGAQR
jgi:glycosyltransferase involved in cell wall biosynthesis